MVTFISRSPEETRALGEAWGKSATPGLVIGLTGDLGAGKTVLVKGVARGLGIKESVHSPTFALLHEYTDGRLPLFHIDLYRLESPSQIIGAGLEEYFYKPAGVTVVEWVERWGVEGIALGAEQPEFPNRAPLFRMVTIETLNATERRIIY